MSIRIGIDLGGTKIEVVALDAQLRTLVRKRVATPVRDYAAIVGVIADLVASVESELGVRASVGIGMPGSLSPATQLARNANSTVLIGKPFVADLQEALGRPIRASNDANCFALSEAFDGAAQRAQNVFAAILGTGVGGGYAVSRRIVEGANVIAGEWGHNSLPWPGPGELPGPRCYCGKYGCIETFLSGPALSRHYLERAGENAAPTEIARFANAGGAHAIACMESYEDRLARGLASIINILDPDAIVLGGGVSNIERLYVNLPALLPRYVFSDTFKTPIVRAAHGDSSGVRGAALLW